MFLTPKDIKLAFIAFSGDLKASKGGLKSFGNLSLSRVIGIVCLGGFGACKTQCRMSHVSCYERMKCNLSVYIPCF